QGVVRDSGLAGGEASARAALMAASARDFRGGASFVPRRDSVSSTPHRRHPPFGSLGGAMLLIREIMYCKPGKVRPLVEKFLAMSELSAKMKMGSFRVMTDVSAERYWTVVSEMEVESLDKFEKMMS